MVWKQPFMLSVTMSSNSSGVVSTPVLPIGPGAAGDVHQDVDAAELVLALGGGALALLRIGQIAGNDDRFGAGRPRLLRHRLDRRDVAADQRELAPSAAKASVIAAPMPLAGPVIIATRPLS